MLIHHLCGSAVRRLPPSYCRRTKNRLEREVTSRYRFPISSWYTRTAGGREGAARTAGDRRAGGGSAAARRGAGRSTAVAPPGGGRLRARSSPRGSTGSTLRSGWCLFSFSFFPFKHQSVLLYIKYICIPSFSLTRFSEYSVFIFPLFKSVAQHSIEKPDMNVLTNCSGCYANEWLRKDLHFIMGFALSNLTDWEPRGSTLYSLPAGGPAKEFTAEFPLTLGWAHTPSHVTWC